MEQTKTQGLEAVARAGYFAKGVVYFMVGLLAATAAFQGGDPQGNRGALQALFQQPFGRVALALVGFGLLGYAVWKFAQAIRDTEHKGSDVSGYVQRGGFVLSGLAHLSIAFFCAQTVLSGGGTNSSSTENAQSATASVMNQPFGQWLIGLAGLVLIAFGLFRMSIAWNRSFKSKFHLEQMSSHEKEIAVKAGVFGIAARAVVFGLTGVFLIKAALTANPQQAGALQQVLQTVEQQGTWYLAVLAFGLIAYAIFQGFMARYRHIKPASAVA